MTLRQVRGLPAMMPVIARVGAQVTAERWRPQAPDDPARVPSRVELITPAWMTAALCGKVPGARVLAIDPTEGSSGTTYRRRLVLELNDAAREGGVPATVFTKSAPGALQRMTQSITGPVEARFYLELRAQLKIEAPHCFHGAVDERRVTAIIVLEDLAATKQATFLGPTTRVTRPEAEQIIDTLAVVHGTFARRAQQVTFAKTYQEMWQDAIALMGIERYFMRCFDEAGDALAPELRRDPRRAWNAVLRSIALHDGRPATLLHNDVHLGNWYRTADGRMGLCDWQAVVLGHWSRDLAYALATTLTTEDRRAWEHDLVARYVERRTDTQITREEAWRGYRQQVWGALAFWAPTYSPPRLMPSDMQPRAVSGELLRRISAACVDLEAFAAVEVK